MKEIKKIKVVFIFEVIGKPPEHLEEVLNNLIIKIGEEKGVEVKDKKINKPILMKNQKEFYASFAEVEIEVEDIGNITKLMFDYMPAHVEIVSPENINLSNNDVSEILSELTRKLHGYDEVARILQTEKNILEKKLRELMPKKEPEKEEKNEKE